MSPPANATTRFSNCVENYVRYRPSYPDELIQTMQAEAGLNVVSVVADVGSGTGISSDLFLRLGCTVYGIEPNAEMRSAAEARFGPLPRFQSLDATAEATSLPDASVDFVCAGQAFHWFDLELTRTEFSRILQPTGVVALFWYSRRTDASDFLRGYEAMLVEFANDYRQVNHTNVDQAVIAKFFSGQPFQVRSFPHFQEFDFDGLRGRLLSSSYIPAPSQARYEPMMQKLRQLFQEHQVDGKVRFDYDTDLYFGRLL